MKFQTLLQRFDVGEFPVNLVVEERPEFLGLLVHLANPDTNDVRVQIRKHSYTGELGVFVFHKQTADAAFEAKLTADWQTSHIIFDSGGLSD